MIDFQKEYKGILLAFTIGIIAYFTGPMIPSFNSILMGLVLGMLVGNLVKISTEFQSGISFTSSKLLELSILFLAFSINYTHIAALGWKSFTAIAIVVIAILLLTIYLSKKLNCPGSTGLLIGFGTTICGSSAIAAVAPSIAKDKEDVGISMAVINLFGSIGMIALPFFLKSTHFSVAQIGLLLGGTLHSVGNVAGAGYSMGSEIGEAAITIKLARVALLSPAIIFFNYLINKNNVSHWKEHFKLPWYLWSFVAITIFTSLVSLPKEIIDGMETMGKFILTVAMAAIGLKVSFKVLWQSGQKGVLFGLLIFAIQIALVGAFMFAI